MLLTQLPNLNINFMVRRRNSGLLRLEIPFLPSAANIDVVETEYWTKLPAEIRIMILDMVEKDYEFDTGQPYLRAHYATVSREWQSVFERSNFRHLILSQEHMSFLKQYLSLQRQSYLELLCLRVRLNEYDCNVCQLKEDKETAEKNNKIFSEAIWQLLRTLKKWTITPFTQKPGSRHQSGLTVELCAYSPSDLKHGDLHLESTYPYEKVEESEQHCESTQSKKRLAGTPLTVERKQGREPKFRIKFPEVKVVTGLLIRRQFYRKIALDSLGRLLRQSFTCISWFRHEGRYMGPKETWNYQKDYGSQILPNLPSTLRDLYLFEDFNEPFHTQAVTRRGGLGSVGLGQAVAWQRGLGNAGLGISLSNYSRSLENLSVAFLADAFDFFRPFLSYRQMQPDPLGWNFRSLALTSVLLSFESGRFREDLLIPAGRAAASMPQLEIMELWDGSENYAAAFLYLHDGKRINDSDRPGSLYQHFYNETDDLSGGPAIICNFPLNYNIISCWSNPPNTARQKSITVKTPSLSETNKEIKSTGSGIPGLKLRNMILDPTSQSQIFWENKRERLRAQDLGVLYISSLCQ